MYIWYKAKVRRTASHWWGGEIKLSHAVTVTMTQTNVCFWNARYAWRTLCFNIYLLHFVALDYLFQRVLKYSSVFTRLQIFIIFFFFVSFGETNFSAWLFLSWVWCCVEFLFMNKFFHLNVDLHASCVSIFLSAALLCGSSRWCTWWCHHRHRHRGRSGVSVKSDHCRNVHVKLFMFSSVWNSENKKQHLQTPPRWTDVFLR